MKNWMLTTIGLVLIFGSTGAFAQGPGSVRVRSLTFAGSGCPAGSVEMTISAGHDELSIDMDGMVAEAGQGISIAASRKNCMIALDLDYPLAWSFGVSEVETSGFVALTAAASATHVTSISFTGQGAQARSSTNFRGPDERDFTVVDTYSGRSLIWSPCGVNRALNMNLELRALARGNTSALITLDSPWNVTKKVKLKWRRCS